MVSRLEFILSRSRPWSRDLKTQVSVLVSRQHAWCLYACSTITVICSNLSECSVTIGIDAASDVISRPWSRDSSALESFCPGLVLETWWPWCWSWCWSQDLKTQVSVLVSRPKKGLDNNTAFYSAFNSDNFAGSSLWRRYARSTGCLSIVCCFFLQLSGTYYIVKFSLISEITEQRISHSECLGRLWCEKSSKLKCNAFPRHRI